MSSGHDHSHGGSGSSTARTRLAIAFAITSVIVLAQAIGSVVTGSLALLTDTAHALVDASGLLVALIAAMFATRPITPKMSSSPEGTSGGSVSREIPSTAV